MAKKGASHTLVVVDTLATTATALRGAMEAADAAAIETAIGHFRAAIEDVQALGAWRDDPLLKQRIEKLLPQLESSRMLACLLGDMTGQRLSALAAMDGAVPQPIYGRPR